MSLTFRRLPVIALALVTLIPLEAAIVSPEGAAALDGKIAQILRHGALSSGSTLRTQVTEDEVNSWFLYRSQPFLPDGLTEPQITLVGDGGLTAQAIVDLDAVAPDIGTAIRIANQDAEGAGRALAGLPNHFPSRGGDGAVLRGGGLAGEEDVGWAARAGGRGAFPSDDDSRSVAHRAVAHARGFCGILEWMSA